MPNTTPNSAGSWQICYAEERSPRLNDIENDQSAVAGNQPSLEAQFPAVPCLQSSTKQSAAADWDSTADHNVTHSPPVTEHAASSAVADRGSAVSDQSAALPVETLPWVEMEKKTQQDRAGNEIIPKWRRPRPVFDVSNDIRSGGQKS